MSNDFAILIINQKGKRRFVAMAHGQSTKTHILARRLIPKYHVDLMVLNNSHVSELCWYRHFRRCIIYIIKCLVGLDIE